MVWGAVAAVAGSIISSKSQKDSASSAARTAEQAAERAKTSYDPYRKAGLSALGQYMELLGLDSRVARETAPDVNVQALLDAGYSEEQASSLAKGKPVKSNANEMRIKSKASSYSDGDTLAPQYNEDLKAAQAQDEREYQAALSNWSINRDRPAGAAIGTSKFGQGGQSTRPVSGGSYDAPPLPGSGGTAMQQQAPRSQADMVRQMIESDPGYQATIDLATQQTSRTAAAQGRASGGGFLTDLYKQNALIAGDFYQKRLSNLSGLINVGSGAGAADAGLTMKAGEINAAGQLATGQSQANMWGNIGTIAGQYFGSKQGSESTNGANSGAVFGG